MATPSLERRKQSPTADFFDTLEEQEYRKPHKIKPSTSLRMAVSKKVAVNHYEGKEWDLCSNTEMVVREK